MSFCTWNNTIKMTLSIIHRNTKVFLQTLLQNVIRSSIMLFVEALIFTQLLPLLGMSTYFIPYLFLGIFIEVMSHLGYGKMSNDLVEYSTNGFLHYCTTLPITIFTFISILIISYIFSMMIGIISAIAGLYMFPNIMAGSQVCWWRLITMVAAILLFWATFYTTTFFIGDWKWVRVNFVHRILTPMKMFGCVYFTWAALYAKSQIVALLLLLNPMTYAVEGLRSALFPSYVGLSFKICLIALLGMCMVNLLLARFFVGKKIVFYE